MVKLFNISVENDTITCDYTPENCDKVGHVVMNIDTKELTSISYSEYEYGKKLYVAHVRKKLAEVIGMSNLPKEVLAVWY